jgi:formyltetrahydrofolate synthetase
MIQARCQERGAEAVLAKGFAQGGAGMKDLARPW